MKDEVIDIVIRPISTFIKRETTAGVVLFLSTIIALAWANFFPISYHHFWDQQLSMTISRHTISNTIHHWINDGLMALFFFVIGLELKREIMAGDLRSPRQAILPLAAAAGGMLVPALLFVFFNPEAPEKNGWGVPMATDIAFVLGVLALFGKRIPTVLKVLLTALAIADDLGAVIVIAFFYTADISVTNLLSGVAFFVILMGANLLGVRSVAFYGIVGVLGLWLAFLMSGVHATIAGVIAAFTIPARPKIDEKAFDEKLRKYVDEFIAIPPNDVTLLEPAQMRVIQKIKSITYAAETPLQRLEHSLHPLVAFVVLPIFALANAGVEIGEDFLSTLSQPLSIGVIVGLVVGKFIGITGTCALVLKLKLAKLPSELSWRHIIAIGFLGGIGFTMSMFITNLAFQDAALVTFAKTGIIAGSLVAGVIGSLILKFSKSPELPQ